MLSWSKHEAKVEARHAGPLKAVPDSWHTPALLKPQRQRALATRVGGAVETLVGAQDRLGAAHGVLHHHLVALGFEEGDGIGAWNASYSTPIFVGTRVESGGSNRLSKLLHRGSGALLG